MGWLSKQKTNENPLTTATTLNFGSGGEKAQYPRTGVRSNSLNAGHQGTPKCWTINSRVDERGLETRGVILSARESGHPRRSATMDEQCDMMYNPPFRTPILARVGGGGGYFAAGLID